MYVARELAACKMVRSWTRWSNSRCALAPTRLRWWVTGGMIKALGEANFRYVTALTDPQVRRLLKAGILQITSIRILVPQHQLVTRIEGFVLGWHFRK